MATVFKILGLVIKFGPVVIGVIREVEVLFGEATSAEKKAAAMRMIKTAVTSRGIAWTEQTESIVSGLVDFAVAALNAFNDWRKRKVATELVKEGKLPEASLKAIQ